MWAFPQLTARSRRRTVRSMETMTLRSPRRPMQSKFGNLMNQPISPIHGALYKGDLEALLVAFKAACDWLTDVGVPSKVTRYGKYEKVFAEFFSSVGRHVSHANMVQRKAAFENAYLEANELVRLHSDLASLNSEEFIQQIGFVASGQEFRATAENDQARDFLFELSTAARFLRVGFPVSLSSISDIVVKLENGAELHVECKRLKSQKRVDKNLRKAISQLQERIQRAPSGSFAMSALDFTDLIPPRPDYVLSSVDEGVPRHAARLKTTLKNHRKAFAQVRAEMWNTGTLCQASGVYYAIDKSLGGDGMVYARHTTYAEYHDEGSIPSNFIRELARRIGSQDIYRNTSSYQNI